jgi:hypothetical protein
MLSLAQFMQGRWLCNSKQLFGKNVNGAGRRLTERSIPALVEYVWGKPRNPLRIVEVLAEIRIGHLPKIIQLCYRLTKLFRWNKVLKHSLGVPSRSGCVSCLASNPTLPPDVLRLLMTDLESESWRVVWRGCHRCSSCIA